MTRNIEAIADRAVTGLDRIAPAPTITKIGRGVALAGVVLPLLLIGLLKFTQIEVDALKPLITNTPWLSWLYPAFGEVGTTALLGTAEIFTAILLIASPWSARAGVLGGAIGSLTFLTTVSVMFALPIWYAELGGFPWINPVGQFLLKDVSLLGVSIVIFGESLTRALAQISRA
jgi:reactive chlorine resistance protein C